jgi:acetyl/propionyl-CoA carboxylase alpha subunit
MFNKVFVANRSEIAVRVIRACRELGIPTAVACSEVDLNAVHADAADEVVCVGPAEAAASYLDVAAVVQAAVSVGADALHPGYGFLSEKGALASACAAAGITFIGPPADVIDAVGDKLTARRTMADAGVPVVPGTFEGADDRDVLAAAAEELGYPVLLKAAGGGGGTGMRRVDRPADLDAALDEAAAEADSAFGNATVYVEKLIEPVRHVEVQILADDHGNVATLGERECSLQRRHQKVLEESPSTVVDEPLRQALCDAAAAAARAVDYRGAGTVEFLLAPDGTFHFLEVNARIQVEHPITEERFGVDLVAEQIRVAAGEPLSCADAEPRGWAMEARLYAEDPALGFMPSPGRITALHLPHGPGIRVDGGVRVGSDVPMEYDPILAKIIAWGPDREACRKRLRDALAETVVLGVASNAAFLRDLLDHPDFVSGATTTQALEAKILDELPGPDEDATTAALLTAAVALAGGIADGHRGEGGPRIEPGPWELLRDVRLPGGER